MILELYVSRGERNAREDALALHLTEMLRFRTVQKSVKFYFKDQTLLHQVHFSSWRAC